jgi:hypothetical protein
MNKFEIIIKNDLSTGKALWKIVPEIGKGTDVKDVIPVLAIMFAKITIRSGTSRVVAIDIVEHAIDEAMREQYVIDRPYPPWEKSNDTN